MQSCPWKSIQKGMDCNRYSLLSIPVSAISCCKYLTSLKSVLHISVCAQHHLWGLVGLIPPKSYLYNEGLLGSNLLAQLTVDLQEGILLIETTIWSLI